MVAMLWYSLCVSPEIIMNFDFTFANELAITWNCDWMAFKLAYLVCIANFPLMHNISPIYMCLIFHCRMNRVCKLFKEFYSWYQISCMFNFTRFIDTELIFLHVHMYNTYMHSYVHIFTYLHDKIMVFVYLAYNTTLML